MQTSALAIARAVGNPGAEGVALECLGSCRSNQGEYRQAIDLLTQANTIACGIGDRNLEGIGLGALGKCYYCLGDYLKSADLHTSALHIAREVGNRQIEGEELGYLGLCRLAFGDYEQAMNLLGIAFGDYEQAMNLLGQALEIAREVGDRYDEANELNYLGRAQLALGDARQAAMLSSVRNDRLSRPGRDPRRRLRSTRRAVRRALASQLAGVENPVCGREDIFGLGTWAHRWRTSSSTEAQDDHKFAVTSMIDRRPGRMLAELARSPLTCTGGRRL